MLCTNFLFFNCTMQLSLKEIKEVYGTRHIGRDQARGLVGLMDFFCFSEVSLPPSHHKSYLIHELNNWEVYWWRNQGISKLSLRSNRHNVMNAISRFAIVDLLRVEWHIYSEHCWVGAKSGILFMRENGTPYNTFLF